MTSPRRATFVTAALLILVSFLSATLLLARWQLDTPGQYTLSLGDPDAQVSGFYPIETSGEQTFRWSRALSGVSLPALATTQVLSVTMNPAREGEVHVRIFEGVTEVPVADFIATTPTWETYTTTVKPGLGTELRIIIESDTFYPGSNDPRRLGVAISEFATTTYTGRFGLTYPPLLLIALAVALPLLAFLLARHITPRAGLVTAAVTVPLITLWTVAAPPEAWVPGAAWLVGLVAAAAILYQAYLWSRSKSGLYPWVRRVLHSRWEVSAVAAFMLVLTVIMTWPLVTHMRTALPSWPGDSFGFLYKIWWFRTALSSGQWPLFDPNSYAPFGFDLGRGEPTLMNNLPGALLAATWNEPVAYNLLAILSFVISGVGAYLLGKELTGSRTAGLLSGVAFAFCSYRFGQYAGHLQLLGTGWIPLLFYFTERALKTHRARDGALAGLMLALTALTAWYYAYMVGLLYLIYLAVRLWALRREIRPKSLLPPAVAGAAVAAILIMPVALPQLLLYRGGELRHTEKAADSASAAPLDYLIPNPNHPLWGEAPTAAHQHENFLDTSLYLGFVPLGIILFGWLMMRRHRLRPPESSRSGIAWLVVGLAAFVLSLGLTLHDLHGQYQLPLAGGSTTLPMPGQLLYDYLPLFSSMRAYARFGVIVSLAVAALMALGWLVFLQSGRFRRHAAFLGTLALALLLADLWTAPYIWGWSKVEPTETAKFLAAQPEGLIMQMPLESSQSGPALWQEVYYGKPIAYGFDTFEPPEWAPVRDRLEQFPADSALDVLRDWGVRYIVVSANAYGEDWANEKAGLDSNPRLKLLITNIERRIWHVDPAPLDARPDMQRFVLPDTLVVYELLS
jgi:hypothetical protein